MSEPTDKQDKLIPEWLENARAYISSLGFNLDYEQTRIAAEAFLRLEAMKGRGRNEGLISIIRKEVAQEIKDEMDNFLTRKIISREVTMKEGFDKSWQAFWERYEVKE